MADHVSYGRSYPVIAGHIQSWLVISSHDWSHPVMADRSEMAGHGWIWPVMAVFCFGRPWLAITSHDRSNPGQTWSYLWPSAAKTPIGHGWPWPAITSHGQPWPIGFFRFFRPVKSSHDRPWPGQIQP